jgi:DNA-directed RNA polymerase specialized sigma24 family protein
MSPRDPSDAPRSRAPAWSPETETREDVKALLLRRSALTRDEVLRFRAIYPDMYRAYFETLACVVRGRGATDAVVTELVHDALGKFWNDTVLEGFPDCILAKLLSNANGLARNHVRREGRNPATAALPTSSKETPGSYPKPDRELALKEVARLLFDRLSPKHQAIVDAVILRDLTVSDAARALKLGRTTAASRFTAAMSLLDEWMDELLSPSERHF